MVYVLFALWVQDELLSDEDGIIIPVVAIADDPSINLLADVVRVLGSDLVIAIGRLALSVSSCSYFR